MPLQGCSIRAALHVVLEYHKYLDAYQALLACKALLENGADPNAKYGDGKTPLDLAKTDEIRDLLKQHGATQ